MSNKNDSRTKAFGTVKNNKGFKSPKSRQKFVIAIFIVIILILASLATLIVSKVVDRLNQTTQPPTLPPANNTTTVPYDPDDIRIGNLLVVDKTYDFDYKLNNMEMSGDMTNVGKLPQNIVNLYIFKNNASNDAATKVQIPGTDRYAPTYELSGLNTANQIALHTTALDAFNRMLLDYCTTSGSVDLSTYTEGSASKLSVAWGWSNYDELQKDLASYGDSFRDHATGMTITLKKQKANNEQETVTEAILKQDFKWIYDNAYKYGFIIRYPDGCKCERSFTTSARVHLRYVGYEHAYYIKTNNLCLEEYITLLRDHHKASGDHLTFTADNGKTYEVYYVALSGKPTSIPVPTDKEYYISGDNMNGFIVTVTQ